MKSELCKSDFKTGYIRSMKPGDGVLVKCNSKMEMQTTRSLVRQYCELHQEKMEESGIQCIKAEKCGDTSILVTAIPLEPES